MLDKLLRSYANVTLKNGDTVEVSFRRDVWSFNDVTSEEEGRAHAALADEINRRGLGDQVDRTRPIFIRERSMSDMGFFQRVSFFSPSHMRLFQTRPQIAESKTAPKPVVVEVTISAKEDYVEPIRVEDLPATTPSRLPISGNRRPKA